MRVFVALCLILLALLSAGWYALTLGPANPIPWPIFNVWGNMITVGMAAEQLVGYVPSDGGSLLHAVFVVGSAALVWAALLTGVYWGATWIVRVMKRLTPRGT